MKAKKDYLWIFLFLIVFINGFEAGGYQASLWTIGQTYDLSATSMGLYAAMELFATMLAPLLLGSWADRRDKGNSLRILLAIQLFASVFILFTQKSSLFLGGIFFLGLTTSALQFIAIAALADAYPVSGKRKIGYMTSMYAAGALISPLIVNYYLKHGLAWRTLFALLAVGSVIAFAGVLKSGSKPRETSGKDYSQQAAGDEFVIVGILMLCMIMCIYVGFENGFTFFVDTLFTDTLHASTGKYALSLFWAVMIPSRVLVGYFSKYSKRILLCALVAIPVVTLIYSTAQNATAALLLSIPLGAASGAIYPSVLTMMLPFAGKKTATATGMITTATGIGGVIFTALTGFLSDQFGTRTAIAILGLFFVISLFAYVGIHMLEKKREG